MSDTESNGVPATGWPEYDPPTPRPWRSAPAAALFNLTGLGLGYLYLGRRWRAAVAAAVTAGLVAVAFATDAARLPLLWLGLGVVLLGGSAADGWRIARPTRQERSGPAAVPDRAARIRPVAIALTAVAAVVTAYLGYGFAGRSVYDDARTAQARGDCRAAIRGFDLVTGPFELTFSRNVQSAHALRAECGEFIEAQRAEEQRRYPDAVAGYRGFRLAHPQSVLVPFATDRLKRTYGAWASALRTERKPGVAIGIYRDLLAELGRDPDAVRVGADLAATYLERSAATREQVAAASAAPAVDVVESAVADVLVVLQEFPDTPAAGTVPKALAETYVAATHALDDQRFCDVVPVLRYFAGLPDEVSYLVETANADRVRALLECGLGRFRGERPADAVEPLTELADAYLNDPRTPQARSTVIAARVAAELGRAVPLPAPLGDDSPGAIPVVYYNDSPNEVTMRVTGATAHEFTLPACSDCSVYGPLDEPSCDSGMARPSHTLYLQPGEIFTAGSSEVEFRQSTMNQPQLLEPNYRYWTCVYTQTEFGGFGT